ncbi:MAG: hypothetical protein GTO53_12985 [Planctomycetales bacterium]|nr:hypothetical protein [Planctomycetales bacterium]NIM10014.1 hypothetical protein [Planctomycetales bacterium]NIN09457.1 hypothetical protein [Planctomycetales bacterium]NIN78565.1 hypothetical protein [Planctomycetales bacterium]NIO35759.1 hypothetical protein [Planctomycetales bacterium]
MAFCIQGFSLRTKRCQQRRGNVIVLATFLMVFLLGLLAFACDLGYLLMARTQLQRAADSAAMASAWTLLDERRLIGGNYLEELQSAARDTAVQYVSLNKVAGANPQLDLNSDNRLEGDVVIGRFVEGGKISTAGDAERYNAVRVRVQRSNDRNGEIGLFFARIFGSDSSRMTADAIATYRDGISGFRANNNTGNVSLLPFALDIKTWRGLLRGEGFDDWAYDKDSKAVFRGPDGLRETRLFPMNKNRRSGITPGNFGTVDIGAQDNSSATLMRQIREGVSQQDLEYHGGQLALDPLSKTLFLDGDTGVDGNLELALDDILGQPRTIPLYSKVSGSGDTATYTIVAFAGIRILDFNLHTNDSYVLIQPALVVDDGAISDGGSSSYAVFQPVILSH